MVDLKDVKEVKMKPIEIWAVVQSRKPGKREIIGTFDNFDDAYKTFMDVIHAPRRYQDDVYGYEIIRTVECKDLFGAPLETDSIYMV